MLLYTLFCIIIHVPRDNIESTHSDEVALLKSQYSDEDKEAIQKFLQAKRTLRQEKILDSRMVQEETDQDSPSGKMIGNCTIYLATAYYK